MTQQFTASEVRNEASNHWRLSDGPQQTLAGKMLHAFTDLLEAREKAVPVKLEYYDAGLLNNFGGGNIDWWWDYIRNELGRAHSFYQSQVDGIMSAPSDAERLAEALRMCMDIMLEHGVPIHPDADARVAYTAAEQALAAHSAQAQPPADQFDPERNVRPGDVGTELQTAEQDAADFGTGFEVDGRRVAPERVRIFRGEHAAQPPAASVPDGFVFERVNMGRGNERYVGLADGSEGTTVQEDGDGPGDTRSRLLWRIADAALGAQENPNG